MRRSKTYGNGLEGCDSGIRTKGTGESVHDEIGSEREEMMMMMMMEMMMMESDYNFSQKSLDWAAAHRLQHGSFSKILNLFLLNSE